MYWIINKNIEFWPENKRLISLKNPAQSVTLTAPASHCLVLLLEATPELVSQQVFFKKVWEDEGILVPANTLYQNISIVRRGLRDVGETDNSIVVTVPRKGFHINPNVNVERMDKKPLNSENYNDITFISQDDVAEKNPTTEPGDIVQTVTRKNIGAKATTFLIMLLSLLAGCLSFHYIWHFHDENLFLAAIHWLKTIAGVIFIPKMITMLKLINLTIINL
ncbi:transcriptional regulator [Klebsiella pneumoniae]|uniref:winged helix-turn-helix domain-containing protein n=1 Tax=Klebsiella pneumoniae TaxID=573 RepID=UPI000AAF4E85|nr:winged helix-turn-helix domain-containing protein [Klebsiella pneumoniae]